MSCLVTRPAPDFTAKAVMPDGRCEESIVRHRLINAGLGRNVDEVLHLLAALQFTEEYGQVCPAEWKAGEQAMAPNPEGVAAYLAQQAG